LGAIAYGDGHPVSSTVVIHDVTMNVSDVTVTDADYLRRELLCGDVTVAFVHTDWGQKVTANDIDTGGEEYRNG
jgi:hypothetical protein